MNVVVLAEASVSDAVAAALSDHTVQTVSSVEATSTVAPPDLFFVSLSVPGVAAFAATVDIPLIAIADDDTARDDFCAVLSQPADPEAVRSALTCAERVIDYQHAVDELYTLCRARAKGNEVSSRKLQEARSSARERLQAVNRSGIPPLKQLLR
ncbi:hypothetical protein [Haladaptatus sp. DJG-WS-42]|uniref:hypothetical protein n=1 Tax=Haladaptatus sp. DJG-WS-42 TaxID=3120516 RepID=UPI0030CCE5F6